MQFCWFDPLAASTPFMRQPVSPNTMMRCGCATGSFRSTPPMVATLWPGGTIASHSVQSEVACGTVVPFGPGRVLLAVAAALMKYCG